MHKKFLQKLVCLDFKSKDSSFAKSNNKNFATTITQKASQLTRRNGSGNMEGNGRTYKD